MSGIRRWNELLTAFFLLTVLLSSCSSPKRAAPASETPTAEPATVAAENARPGTDSWRIAYAALDGEIAGYAGATSYNRGDTVDLHISASVDGTRYSIEVYRLGWYGGAGGRLLAQATGQRARAQGYWSAARGLQDCASCVLDSDTGLLDANWATTYRQKLEASWPSGMYVAKLQTDEGKQAYIPWVVRDDRRAAGVLVQLSVNTWQAYNAWGDASLYGSFNASRQWTGKDARAHKVSYNRPYDPMENGIAEYGAGEFFRFEYNFVRWLESQDYDATYATDIDVHERPGLLDNRRAFVSVGHDEYWSWDQRANVEAARDRGVGLAFFGGNDVYWQVRLEAGQDGERDRTLVCYKDATLDPAATANALRATVEWAADPVNRPQSLLTGTTYGTNATPEQQPWVVADDTSWVFEGSGLRAGDEIEGIVGYEYDRPADPAVTPQGMITVGLSPVRGWEGADHSASALYQAPSGAWVFSAGTIQWSWGLDDLGHENIGQYRDARLQRVTKNILDTLIQGPQSHPTTATPAG